MAFVGLPIDWKNMPEGIMKPVRKITERKIWKHLSANWLYSSLSWPKRLTID